jgi:8-oxo-dGTP pyrophosphatase MutT (NUDIX family)
MTMGQSLPRGRRSSLKGRRFRTNPHAYPMQERPSSRLLVLDARNRVLLFRFDDKRGPLAGKLFWATPGGGLERGESFEEAARRELFEETGLQVEDVGPQVGRRIASFQLTTGEMVSADERFFAIRLGTLQISTEHWTELEREVMTDHRWWSQAELRSATEQIWPEDLADMLINAGIWGPQFVGH